MSILLQTYQTVCKQLRRKIVPKKNKANKIKSLTDPLKNNENYSQISVDIKTNLIDNQSHQGSSTRTHSSLCFSTL